MSRRAVLQPSSGEGWPPYSEQAYEVEPHGQLGVQGVVSGIHWSLRERASASGETVFQYALGQRAAQGEGQISVWLSESTDLSLTAHAVGLRDPHPIVAYVAITSSRTTRILVSLTAGHERTIPTRPISMGGIRYCIFFPPYGHEGFVHALDEGGGFLETIPLYQLLVAPQQVCQVGVGSPRIDYDKGG